MACQFRVRRDDIPKYRGERSWECERCSALAFSRERPVCRETVRSEMQARRVFADAETTEERTCDTNT